MRKDVGGSVEERAAACSSSGVKAGPCRGQAPAEEEELSLALPPFQRHPAHRGRGGCCCCLCPCRQRDHLRKSREVKRRREPTGDKSDSREREEGAQGGGSGAELMAGQGTCRTKGCEHFPQCSGRGWAVVALTDTSWMGRNNKKQYEKESTSLPLFRERKDESHGNWAPPLGFGGGKGSESALFQALVILAKPSLLSAASARD